MRRGRPGLASRVDPEDIVQSVFRSFFQRAITDAYSVPAGQDLWKLLLTIALNKVRSQGVYHRAAKRDVLRSPLRRAARLAAPAQCRFGTRPPEADVPIHAWNHLKENNDASTNEQPDNDPS